MHRTQNMIPISAHEDCRWQLSSLLLWSACMVLVIILVAALSFPKRPSIGMNTASRCGQRPAVRESGARAIETFPATKQHQTVIHKAVMCPPPGQTPGRLMFLLLWRSSHCIDHRPCTASESHSYHFAAVSGTAPISKWYPFQ